LSLAQSALLAALPKSPSRYRPDRFPERAKARRDYVLNRMLALGIITAAQHASAIAEPIDAAWHPLPQAAQDLQISGIGPCMMHMARDLAGGRWRTTLDLATQQQAAALAREHLDLLQPDGVRDIAIVILDTQTAQCLASVSLSADPLSLDLTRCPRSTGSALKPLIYAAAFDAGICTPNSLLRDSPAAWPGYAPDNYDRAFRGSISAAQALAESRNIPAIRLLSELGPEHFASLCGASGLATIARRPQRYGLTLAVGGGEATALELGEAYATLARFGPHIPARDIIEDQTSVGWGLPHQSNCREDHGGASPTLLSPNACRQTLAALSRPDRTLAISPEAARLNIAWKTGTSSGHRDAWCAAVTATRTVVVWMGNRSGRGSRALVGADLAAPLALRLAASLETVPAIWLTPANASAGATPPALPRISSRPRLTILSPLDGAEMIYLPDLPPIRQRVSLKAIFTTGPDITDSASRTLWWFADGQLVGATADARPLWWSPTPGRHEFRVTDSQGRCATARIRVR
jgi:penicillin-binding protein 1C